MHEREQAERLFPSTKEGPRVHNGTYTVSHPERGHFTLKLHTAQGGKLRGERIVSLLVGPDNVSDFKGVAFWNDERGMCHVWRRYRGPDSRMPVDGYHWQDRGWSAYEQKLEIWTDLVVRGAKGFHAGAGYTLQLAGRCVRCNRELTDPESIRTGIGPVCAGRS